MKEKIIKILELPIAIRIVILASIVSLILFSYYYFSYSGVKEQLTTIQGELESMQLEISKRRGIAANLETYKAEVEKLDAELKRALQELPDKKAIEQLLARISDKAKDSGLDVNLFRPEPEEIRDFYAEVPVHLEVTGSYHQLATFFDELSNLSRIVNVNEFQMIQPTVKAGEVLLSNTVNVVSFRFLEENERPKEEEEVVPGQEGEGTPPSTDEG